MQAVVPKTEKEMLCLALTWLKHTLSHTNCIAQSLLDDQVAAKKDAS